LANRKKTGKRATHLQHVSRLIPADLLEDMRRLYDRFSTSITDLDCGEKCAPFNPNGKPFCCDICHAVPAVYRAEWDYLQKSTDLWHLWRGDECAGPEDVARLQAETPEEMVLLACKGPAHCQRDYRALSCRQFPFFPYVTEDYRFLGLTYEWEFENQCWVVSNIGRVTQTYRAQFVELHDALFAQRQEIFDSYAIHSERMRAIFANQHRRIPLLHRNGGFYLVSPKSERLKRVPADRLPRFGPYQFEK
jgi:hypothetical protein